MLSHVEKLRKALGMQQGEGVLVYNPSNMFYLSGYRGEGLVLITPAGQYVVTDFRYTEQAEAEAPGFTVCMTDAGKSHEKICAELCAQQQIAKLWYEADEVTVSTFAKCQREMPQLAFEPIENAITTLRELKDEQELALIAKACEITGDSFERVLSFIKEGMTEREIALFLDFDMMSHGAEKSSFSTIVAAGAHGSLPHAVPGEYRIRKGDMITMDFGARFGNYCADMTRTVALGEPSAEMKHVYEVVLEAQKRAQDAVKAGVVCSQIDAIARNYIDSCGYQGRFGHGLGHAVGIDIHESPRFNTVCGEVTKVGQVMTVEPGIYLPGIGGVRIENSVVVRENGCDVLTKPTRELIIL